MRDLAPQSRCCSMDHDDMSLLPELFDPCSARVAINMALLPELLAGTATILGRVEI